MNTLFNCADLSDVTLVLSDGEKTIHLPAHRAVLANRCPYFRQMFLSKFKEQSSAQVELKVDDVDVAYRFIEWMYGPNTDIPIEADELADEWLVAAGMVYPHPPVQFTCIGDNNGRISSLTYTSCDNTSSIRKLRLSYDYEMYGGARAPSVELYYNRDDKDLDKYLKHRGLSGYVWEGSMYIEVSSYKDYCMLLHIMMKYNTFSHEGINSINNFISLFSTT